MKNENLWEQIHKLKLGSKKKFEIEVPELYGIKSLTIPVLVKRGLREGPTVLITSAVHGDEINHINTCHRLYQSKNFEVKAGLLVILPVVNIYGYINKSRYFPDRRDLNRCFPGSEKGSLASQIAYLVSNTFISKADYIIDMHTAAVGRFNTPQVRCTFENEQLKSIAPKLQVPIVLNSQNREGSLRYHAQSLNKPCLVFEAGEALRQNNYISAAGLRFLKSVLSEIGMMDKKIRKKQNSPISLQKSHWLRAQESGLLVTKYKEGKLIRKGQILAEIRNIRGDSAHKIYCQADGVILGVTVNPLIIKGDAIFHIGFIKNDDIDNFQDQSWSDEYNIE